MPGLGQSSAEKCEGDVDFVIELPESDALDEILYLYMLKSLRTFYYLFRL